MKFTYTLEVKIFAQLLSTFLGFFENGTILMINQNLNGSKKFNLINEKINFTFSEYMISNCPLVPMDRQFPQANASKLPWRLSMIPDLAAFIKELPGFCNKIPKFQHEL